MSIYISMLFCICPVVKIIMDSDTIEEGQKLSMKLRNEGNERILYAVKTISGTALQSEYT